MQDTLLANVKILYFSRDFTVHDHRFLSALAKTEHEVLYLRLERRGHSQEDRPLPVQVEQVHWSGGEAPARLYAGPRLLASLREVIRRVRPDLIQAGPIQTVAFLVALSGFRPLVSMSWGYDLLLDADRNAWWRWATRFTLSRSASMVGDCLAVRQKAVSLGMADERIVTFPWGVDLRYFNPQGREEAGRGPFTLLSTRSWEPVYGVDMLAQAFARAAQDCPELRLVMLGNGSQASMIHQIFMRAGVQERVYFPGQVSQADLPRYYRSVDLYVSASHSDGTSISLLEALACGCPVLLSDIPGNREWVVPGVQGWLFPDGDVQTLAQAILSAWERRQDLLRMGRAARTLAEQRADWEKNFQQLFEAYRLALQYATGG